MNGIVSVYVYVYVNVYGKAYPPVAVLVLVHEGDWTDS